MDETDDNDAAALSRQIFEIPTRVDARVALARIYYADGKAEQAKAFLQEGVFYAAGANDRLLKLAAAMIEIKALPEAIACLQNALRIDPEAGPAYALLAESWARLGEMQKAQGYAARAQAKGMSCDLSAYSDGPTPALARHLFDQYAANFESHLHSLDYRVPDYLAALLSPYLSDTNKKSIVDLGCGTGLMATHLRPFASSLVGVDLSPGMLEQAAARDSYDELIESDIVSYLETTPVHLDVIVAADVLVYLGPLEPLMAAVAKTLATGGLFAATIEYSSEAPYRLTEARRYAHAPAYIEILAGSYGLKVDAMQTIVPRRDRGQAVDGRMFLLRKLAAGR